jgi:hypothetical protein
LAAPRADNDGERLSQIENAIRDFSRMAFFVGSSLLFEEATEVEYFLVFAGELFVFFGEQLLQGGYLLLVGFGKSINNLHHILDCVVKGSVSRACTIGALVVYDVENVRVVEFINGLASGAQFICYLFKPLYAQFGLAGFDMAIAGLVYVEYFRHMFLRVAP